MSKIAIVFWSGTGNTAAMADLVAQGVKEMGAEAIFADLSSFDPSSVSAYDGIAFGCPSMGVEQLEESEFEPMFASIERSLTGKRVALFGSYDWGDGQWMRDWQTRTEEAGASLVADGLYVHGAPAGEDAERCITLGRAFG